jgi:hypothetical protein
MEIKEDIELEFGGETEAGATAGLRAATRIPRFTGKELKAGLGEKVSDQIEGLFRQIEHPQKK